MTIAVGSLGSGVGGSIVGCSVTTGGGNVTASSVPVSDPEPVSGHHESDDENNYDSLRVVALLFFVVVLFFFH
jgi:hypothetical protein